LYTERYNSDSLDHCKEPGSTMDNRSGLLSCALKLFASRGYDAVGVQEIVDAAGVTKPTLYHYFGSKGGLLNTLLSEHFTGLYRSIEQVATYRGDLSRTLTAVARAYFSYAREHMLFYRLQLAMWFAPPESDGFQAIARLGERQQRVIEEIFRRAAQDHGNMRGRHRAYAATFLGMINTYVGLALNGYVELEDELVFAAVRQFMHGIFS
jgi:TetR/AcrR family transcriptional regulator